MMVRPDTAGAPAPLLELDPMHRPTRNRLTAALFGAAILALGLTGCGDKEGAAPTTSAPTTAAPTTTTAGSLSADDETSPGSGLFGASDDDSGASSSSSSSSSEDELTDEDVYEAFGSDLVDVDLAVALWGACGEGDMQACETLFLDSAERSDAEAWGLTCGGLDEDDEGLSCLDRHDSASTGDYVPLAVAYRGATPSDDIVAQLVQKCGEGSMNACDALLVSSAEGSEPYEYGELCGGRSDDTALCVDQFGLGKAALQQWLDDNGLSA